jgi:hypothetical protein
MNKRKKPSPKFDVGAEVLKVNKLMPLGAPLVPRNGENSVEFNQYLVVYSNNISGNLNSAWRAGGTSISCYKNDAFVGVISFYQTAERMRGGYISGNGILVVEFPIGEFEDIMRILKTFNNLYLLFVEKDNNGTALSHPVGAIMTFQKKAIGT